jgi:hypothetical protein
VDEGSKLLLVNHGLAMEGRILDLSLDGCRMGTRERFTGGVRSRVEVTFKINGIAFRFCGLTQWTDGRNQVGIRFVDVMERRRGELAEVIREVEEDLAAKAAKVAAEKLEAKRQGRERAAQEQAAQAERARVILEETGRRAAQETAMRRATAEQAAQQVLEQGAMAKAGELPAKPGKRERRAQLRHEVDTSVVIHLINIGSIQRGRIVDLSASGCRINADERFPVGIYTRVETEFRLEGLPFRLGGVVQAIHDRNHRVIGIRFLDMSERKRVQVEQLIGEIEEMRATRNASG